MSRHSRRPNPITSPHLSAGPVSHVLSFVPPRAIRARSLALVEKAWLEAHGASELWNPLLVALDDRALTHDSVHAHFNQLARAPPAVRRSVESCTEIVLMRSTADVDGARPDVDETVLSDSFTTLRFPALRRVTIDAFLPSAFGLGEMGALAGTRQSLEDRVELLSPLFHATELDLGVHALAWIHGRLLDERPLVRRFTRLVNLRWAGPMCFMDDDVSDVSWLPSSIQSLDRVRSTDDQLVSIESLPQLRWLSVQQSRISLELMGTVFRKLRECPLLTTLIMHFDTTDWTDEANWVAWSLLPSSITRLYVYLEDVELPESHERARSLLVQHIPASTALTLHTTIPRPQNIEHWDEFRSDDNGTRRLANSEGIPVDPFSDFWS